MWEIILLLWSIPLALGIVMLARVARGTSAVTEEERRLVFGDTKENTLSLWMGFKLAALAVLLFLVGVFQGLVLLNISSFWLVLVPLMTALGAMLILALCLRSGSSESGIPQQNTAQPENRASGIVPR